MYSSHADLELDYIFSDSKVRDRGQLGDVLLGTLRRLCLCVGLEKCQLPPLPFPTQIQVEYLWFSRTVCCLAEQLNAVYH